MVGGDYFARNLEALAVEGRLVEIATLHGAKAEVNIQPIMQRRLTITGSTLRPRSVADKGAIAAALRQHVWPLLEVRRGEAGRPRDVPAARRGRGAPRDGVERAHRQARARRVEREHGSEQRIAADRICALHRSRRDYPAISQSTDAYGQHHEPADHERRRSAPAPRRRPARQSPCTTPAGCTTRRPPTTTARSSTARAITASRSRSASAPAR